MSLSPPLTLLGINSKFDKDVGEGIKMIVLRSIAHKAFFYSAYLRAVCVVHVTNEREEKRISEKQHLFKHKSLCVS